MNAPVQKSRIKKVSFAVVLFFFMQWVHGGLIVCIGADGHVAFQQPEAKGCCKENEPKLVPDVMLHSSLDRCVDIPVRDHAYTVSRHPVSPVFKDSLALCSNCLLLCLTGQSFWMPGRQNIPPAHDHLLATLKTVVLLV
jgi:hypothetical protein